MGETLELNTAVAAVDAAARSGPNPAAAEHVSNDGPLRTRLIDDADSLTALAPTWHALVDAAAQPFPWWRPSWLLPWIDVYGVADGLAALAVEDESGLRGLALLRRRRVGRLGFTVNRLEFVGCDVPEDDGVCGDDFSIIAEQGYEAPVAEALADALVGGAAGPWDEFAIQRAAIENPALVAFLDALARRGVDVETTIDDASTVLELTGDWDAILSRMSKSRRCGFRKSWRAFEAWVGDRRWRLDRAYDAESARRGLEILTALHKERWGAVGALEDAAFGAPRFDAFHERYVLDNVAADPRADGVDIRWLTVGDAPIAAGYWIRDAGVLSFYQTGRRMDVPTNVQIGTILVIARVKAAIEEGVSAYDFLAGPAEYKRRFGTSSRPLGSVRIARPCGKETTLRALRAAKRGVATALHGVRETTGRILRPTESSGD